MQSVNPLTPLSNIQNRSIAFDATSTKLFQGRWAAINSSGLAVVPSAGASGLYLVWGASHDVKAGLGADAFDSNGALVDGTNIVALPDAAVSGQIAGLYGIFRASVAPVGFVGTGIAVGDFLQVDAAGRLVKATTGTKIAQAEAIAADRLVFRTLGA